MKDTKSLLLLLVSLLLVVVSFVLIWTWGYNYYSKSKVVKTNTGKTLTDPDSLTRHIKDSIQKVYTATLSNLDIQLDSTLTRSDSLKTELDVKLAEFYRLRNEITRIIKSRNADRNYTVTQQKIAELQVKIDDLKEKSQDVDNENKKLSELLNQINNTGKDQDKNIQTTGKVKSNIEERSAPLYPVFTASALKLTAIINSLEKETETTVAEKTGKLNGSFTIVNFNSQLANAEIIVVVLGPDGRVLKNSGWDSGTFNTPAGKKVYSYKFNFNYTRGEAKHLLFSLRGDNLTKGNYIMEVYQNGLLIGRMVKTLS